MDRMLAFGKWFDECSANAMSRGGTPDRIAVQLLFRALILSLSLQLGTTAASPFPVPSDWDGIYLLYGSCVRRPVQWEAQ